MKYKTIVIDPPWNVKSNMKGCRLNKNHLIPKKLPYKIITDEELILFPIHDFTDDQCDLFMWVTHTKLPFALELIKEWGFKYHCLITWDKGRGLTMLGFHRRTEFIIYAYKGKMGINKSGKSIPTQLNAKSTKHSEKPNAFYEMIKNNTCEPRIDIFARKRHEGFEAWGDHVETTLQLTLRRNGNE